MEQTQRTLYSLLFIIKMFDQRLIYVYLAVHGQYIMYVYVHVIMR